MTVKEFKKMVQEIDSKYDDYDIQVYERGSVYETVPKSINHNPYDKNHGTKRLTLTTQ